jgi:outer membrane protein assembly factor BamB
MKRRSDPQYWLAFLGLTGSLTFLPATMAAASLDQNWPQWRGPLQNGVAPAANPPTAWSETSHIKWKVKIPGGGQATPIIWDDRVFLQTAIPTGKKTEATPAEAAEQPPPPRSEPGGESPQKGPGGPFGKGGKKGPGGFGPGPKPTEVYQFAVLCLDRQTGKVLWQQVAREEVPHEGYRQGEGSFASTSDLTDGKHLYAYFGSHGLYCYDFDGKPVWGQDLGRMRMAMGFGEGSSPTIYRDTLIVNRDNEDGSCIIVLDKNTGKTLWKKPREEHTSWSTPLIIERDGKAQAVVTATGKIRSYDVASGDVLWECGGLTRNVIPCPPRPHRRSHRQRRHRLDPQQEHPLCALATALQQQALLLRQQQRRDYLPGHKVRRFALRRAEAEGPGGRLCFSAWRRRQGLSGRSEWRHRSSQAV